MPIMHTIMKRITLHMTVKQIESLKKLSKSTGLKLAEIVRRAVDEFIKSFKSVL